jgi:nicotinamidase/pyrazinamidase
MRALILVDLQNDFLPHGQLPVPAGDEVLAVANRLLAARSVLFDHVVATQDWHPPGHRSFASSHPGHKVGEVIDLHGLPQVLWPDHCVQATRGAAFADGLTVSLIDKVFPKGENPEVDSYSGFYDNARRSDTGLSTWLKTRGVIDVVVMGLATDYCVKATVLDALSEGFKVSVVTDGCRGVNAKHGDDRVAIDAMKKSGAVIVALRDLLSGGEMA